MLERVAIPPPGDLPDPGASKSPALAGWLFITSTTWEAPVVILTNSNKDDSKHC